MLAVMGVGEPRRLAVVRSLASDARPHALVCHVAAIAAGWPGGGTSGSARVAWALILGAGAERGPRARDLFTRPPGARTRPRAASLSACLLGVVVSAWRGRPLGVGLLPRGDGDRTASSSCSSCFTATMPLIGCCGPTAALAALLPGMPYARDARMAAPPGMPTNRPGCPQPAGCRTGPRRPRHRPTCCRPGPTRPPSGAMIPPAPGPVRPGPDADRLGGPRSAARSPGWTDRYRGS